MSMSDIIRKVSKAFNGASDPVCGMKVNLEQAQYKSTYKGKTYAFCSLECKETFDKTPEQYKSS